MKKIDRGKQMEAVRSFCKNLPDGKEFTVCILLMKGVPEIRIRRRLHLNNDAWYDLKETIGEGLKKAGVQLRD